MPINVTCPSCFKRFTVSDKFAGKSGPCPSCQKPIKIPEKAEQVVIHAPADSGPKDKAGKAILKPIRRKDVKISMPVIVGSLLASLTVFAVALGLGLSGEQPHTAVLVTGALLLAPPLVFVGYWFLHDDELEPYSGKQLLVRCGICALAFAAIWALYSYVPRYLSDYEAMGEYSGLHLAVSLPLMVILGTIVAVAALELEVPQAAMHYALYLGVTFVLAWLAGTHLAQPLSGGRTAGTNAVQPAAPLPPGDTPAEQPSDRPTVPSLLQ